eukprot:TRINITY_DN13174_c1_g1_i2.p1 TRINITY_DN13174_c1_g1~~TRINITY_DN13174_c1_g1_i2.p1  ORF type:complete len:440 (+),score=126.87 TRINITY_DN13174_c1_g1_i2:66-1322(+)
MEPPGRLHSDTLGVVLSCLPLSDLRAARAVCRRWRDAQRCNSELYVAAWRAEYGEDPPVPLAPAPAARSAVLRWALGRAPAVRAELLRAAAGLPFKAGLAPHLCTLCTGTVCGGAAVLACLWAAGDVPIWLVPLPLFGAPLTWHEYLRAHASLTAAVRVLASRGAVEAAVWDSAAAAAHCSGSAAGRRAAGASQAPCGGTRAWQAAAMWQGGALALTAGAYFCHCHWEAAPSAFPLAEASAECVVSGCALCLAAVWRFVQLHRTAKGFANWHFRPVLFASFVGAAVPVCGVVHLGHPRAAAGLIAGALLGFAGFVLVPGLRNALEWGVQARRGLDALLAGHHLQGAAPRAGPTAELAVRRAAAALRYRRTRSGPVGDAAGPAAHEPQTAPALQREEGRRTVSQQLFEHRLEHYLKRLV